ncbi:hypothetical protein C6502_05375 [Candidatus Poribacteria bacterium]|nr:MAG: hypothetical protein C6502_05375 [Candidatus Poribacteria bacterium]
MEFSPEIIRRIEVEVAKVLNQQGLALTSPQSDKRILAIFDATEVNLARPLEQLDKCIQGGYVVTAMLSEIATKILDISRIRSVCGQERIFIADEITNLQPFTEGFSLIVIPTLSCTMAAKLSLGMADTPCAYLVFQGLLRGNRVIATVDGFEISDESAIPPEISKLGKNYIKTLSDFGIQFVVTDQIAETVLSDGTHHFNPELVGGQNIITASVIAGLPPNVREFGYTNPAIITPLARDLAARKGIRLVARD